MNLETYANVMVDLTDGVFSVDTSLVDKINPNFDKMIEFAYASDVMQESAYDFDDFAFLCKISYPLSPTALILVPLLMSSICGGDLESGVAGFTVMVGDFIENNLDLAETGRILDISQLCDILSDFMGEEIGESGLWLDKIQTLFAMLMTSMPEQEELLEDLFMVTVSSRVELKS